MKKLVSILLCAVIAVSLCAFTGCSKTAAATRQELISSPWQLCSLNDSNGRLTIDDILEKGYTAEMTFAKDGTCRLEVNTDIELTIDGTYECSNEDPSFTVYINDKPNRSHLDYELFITVPHGDYGQTLTLVSPDSDKLIPSADDDSEDSDDSDQNAPVTDADYDGDLACTVWLDEFNESTRMYFGSGNRFALRMGDSAFNGTWSCDEDAVILDFKGDETWVCSRLKGTMMVIDSLSFGSLEYNSALSGELRERLSLYAKDITYSGNLADTVWSVSNWEQENGNTVDGEVFALCGIKGELSFGSDGRYLAELFEENVLTGSYEENGGTIIVSDSKGARISLERNGGVIRMAVLDGADNAIEYYEFTYNPVLSGQSAEQ